MSDGRNRTWLVIAIAALFIAATELVLLVARSETKVVVTAPTVEKPPEAAKLAVAKGAEPPPHEQPAPTIEVPAPPAPARKTIVPHEPPPPRESPSARESPPAPEPTPAHDSPPAHDPTAEEIALLYARVGRELDQLAAQKGPNAAVDLWPRYRWVRIQDSIVSAQKRRETFALLDRLRRDVEVATR